VVVGELVPKQLGLLAPEKIASFIAPSMNVLARVAYPLVWLLSATSGFVLRATGAVRKPEPPVTNEEIKVLMAQVAEAGVFHVSERALVSNVLRLDEQRITTIMTPRNEIYTLDLNESETVIRNRIAESPYTRLVVCRDGLNNIVGILRTADLLKDVLEGRPLTVEKSLRRPLYVPESVTTTHLLENLRKARQQCALIVDEYGELQGMVTLTDVMIAIVGDIPTSDVAAEQDIIMRKDNSWLIDGGVTVERMKAVLDIVEVLPGEEEKSFNTLGGFAMHMLDRIPMETDAFEAAGFRFEVIDMDKNRVDKVLVKRVVPPDEEFDGTE
jgi:putative hemolysin